MTDRLKKMIENQLRPNPAEWAMDAEDVLTELNMLSDEARKHIDNVKTHNGAFPQFYCQELNLMTLV